MLALKDALMWRGRLFIWRAEFLKGHLPEAAAGGKHKPSRVPGAGEHVKADNVCSKQTGSGFLVWQLPEPILHKTLRGTLFLVNTARNLEAGAPAKGAGSPACHVCQVWSWPLEALSINYSFWSATHPITIVHFWKIRCLLGEILFPICFSELLWIELRCRRARRCFTLTPRLTSEVCAAENHPAENRLGKSYSLQRGSIQPQGLTSKKIPKCIIVNHSGIS